MNLPHPDFAPGRLTDTGQPERARGLQGPPDGKAIPAGALAPRLPVPDVGPQGAPLSQWLGQAMPVAQLLPLALDLAHLLDRLHRRGVQHLNLHPDSIFLMPEQLSLRIAISHFEPAHSEGLPAGPAGCDAHPPAFAHPRDFAPAVACAAPELAGRSGHPVDERTDLYALGATLYALACGAPPYLDSPADADPLHLVRRQLAGPPEPPHLRRPGLPRALSQVILKLLALSPDQRYQSAHGLALDLAELCVRQQAGQLADLPFLPGRQDHPEQLRAPAALVGREPESRLLAQALDEATTQGKRCLLVHGAAGSGKTRLIDSLRPLLTARGGGFVTGRFDAPADGAPEPVTPADGLMQALGALGRWLLAEPEAERAEQSQRLRQALGDEACVIGALLPEFGELLGHGPALPAWPEWPAMPEVPEAPAVPQAPAMPEVAEADDDGPAALTRVLPGLRLHGDPARYAAGRQRPTRSARPGHNGTLMAEIRQRLAIVQLLRAVTSAQRPLVLVVDGLHAASPAALRLFDALVQAPRLPGLLLIGTWQTPDRTPGQPPAADPPHPLAAWLQHWGANERSARCTRVLPLGPLSAEAQAELVARMLRLPPAPCAELARALAARTAGQPQAIVQALLQLRRDGVLVPGPQGWAWPADLPAPKPVVAPSA